MHTQKPARACRLNYYGVQYFTGPDKDKADQVPGSCSPFSTFHLPFLCVSGTRPASVIEYWLEKCTAIYLKRKGHQEGVLKIRATGLVLFLQWLLFDIYRNKKNLNCSWHIKCKTYQFKDIPMILCNLKLSALVKVITGILCLYQHGYFTPNLMCQKTERRRKDIGNTNFYGHIYEILLILISASPLLHTYTYVAHHPWACTENKCKQNHSQCMHPIQTVIHASAIQATRNLSYAVRCGKLNAWYYLLILFTLWKWAVKCKALVASEQASNSHM